MDRTTILILLAILGLGFFLWQQDKKQPEPNPVPAPTGPDLLTPFQAGNNPQAAEHAQAFGEICGALANMLEDDWQQQQPRITTAHQVDDLRRTTRELHMEGMSFNTSYPQLRAVVERYMTEKLGTKGGTLTTDLKYRWIETFRDLERSALYAADQL